MGVKTIITCDECGKEIDPRFHNVCHVEFRVEVDMTSMDDPDQRRRAARVYCEDCLGTIEGSVMALLREERK